VEVIRERLKQHKTKEFWVSAIVFVSKDENLTKAHVRFLESRLLAEASQIGRFTLEQNQAGGSKLPESDREDSLASPVGDFCSAQALRVSAWKKELDSG
jgi:hypothetical protein